MRFQEERSRETVSVRTRVREELKGKHASAKAKGQKPAKGTRMR